MRIIFDSKLLAYNTQHRGQPIVSLFDDLARMIKTINSKGLFGSVQEIYGVYDFGKSSYRNKLLPSYKGHRNYGSNHENFSMQYTDIITPMSIFLGCGVMQVKGVEADDLAGILVSMSLDDMQTYLITSDRDWWQLVLDNEHISLFDPRTYKIYDKAAVIEATGCTNVAQFLTKKAILGDTSDGILGLNMCGDKCYEKWSEKVYPMLAGIPPEKHLAFLKKEFVTLASSDKKLKIPPAYREFGVDTFEKLWDLNIQLGAIMTDDRYLTPSQSLSYSNWFVAGLPDGLEFELVQNIVAREFTDYTGCFGEPFELDPSTLTTFKGVFDARRDYERLFS